MLADTVGTAAAVAVAVAAVRTAAVAVDVRARAHADATLRRRIKLSPPAHAPSLAHAPAPAHAPSRVVLSPAVHVHALSLFLVPFRVLSLVPSPCVVQSPCLARRVERAARAPGAGRGRGAGRAPRARGAAAGAAQGVGTGRRAATSPRPPRCGTHAPGTSALLPLACTAGRHSSIYWGVRRGSTPSAPAVGMTPPGGTICHRVGKVGSRWWVDGVVTRAWAPGAVACPSPLVQLPLHRHRRPSRRGRRSWPASAAPRRTGHLCLGGSQRVWGSC